VRFLLPLNNDILKSIEDIKPPPSIEKNQSQLQSKFKLATSVELESSYEDPNEIDASPLSSLKQKYMTPFAHL
jgi:hypothetical protein